MADSKLFEPLKQRGSLGNDIAQQLQRRIRDGTFKPGDVLPGQRELASSFGASLSSVREAISVLSAAGLVEARAGKGTTVRSVSEGSSGDFEGWLGVLGNPEEARELVEARKLLEQHSVQQAALKSGPDDATKLYGLLSVMHKAVRDRHPEEYAEADIAFHIGIAEIAGNRVIVRLMKSMHTALYQLFREGIRKAFAEDSIGAHFEMHKRLTQALTANDPAAALEALTDMLDGSSPEYIALLTEDAGTSGGSVSNESEAESGIVGSATLRALLEAYREAIGPAADLLFEETAERLNLRLEILPVRSFGAFLTDLTQAIEHPQLRVIFQSRVTKLLATNGQPGQPGPSTDKLVVPAVRHLTLKPS
jgi:GntR family transcriptional regulator, transcriptional repressor for pyruvate dehydrogenase complex